MKTPWQPDRRGSQGPQNRRVNRNAIQSVAQCLGAHLVGADADPVTIFNDVQRQLIDGLAAELGCCDATYADAGARPFLQSLALEVTSPLRSLSTLRETLLLFQPTLTQSGDFAIQVNTSLRKRTGAFYTPWRVAIAVAEAAMESFDDQSEPPTVLDPAMGTGIFLLAAFHVMRDRWMSSPLELAEQKLWGFDLDPMAIRVAILGLALETGARPEKLRNKLTLFDPLSQDVNVHPHPDVIIGNPPWGAQAQVKAGASHDSFTRFLDLGARLTHGTLGMVVPQAVLMQTAYAHVRAILLHRLAPQEVMLLGNGLFPGVTAPACAIVLGPHPGPPVVRVRDCRQQNLETKQEVVASRWTSEGFCTERDELSALWERLRACHLSLGDLRDQYRVRDAGLNYSHASVAIRSLYRADRPEDPRDLPLYRGRDFYRYTEITRSAWVRYDAAQCLCTGERFSAGWQTVRTPEKLVFRQTADRLVCTLDQTRMVMGRSVLAITGDSALSLPALLACLNSRLMTALYQVRAGEEGRALPQVKVGRVLALPVLRIATCPFPPDGTYPGAVLWQRLHMLALRQLARGEPEPGIDHEIDDLVERLYGLTDMERLVLDGCARSPRRFSLSLHASDV